MGAGRRRKPNAFLGFLKAIGVLIAMLFLLPVWLVRAMAARAKFRSELRAAGVPKKTAKTLSDRYKIRLRDLKGFGQFVNN